MGIRKGGRTFGWRPACGLSFRWGNGAPDEFTAYVIAFLVLIGQMPQIVGKEEDLEDEKHDKQFHKDNEPQRAAERHVSEAFEVEVPDVGKCILHIQST